MAMWPKTNSPNIDFPKLVKMSGRPKGTGKRVWRNKKSWKVNKKRHNYNLLNLQGSQS